MVILQGTDAGVVTLPGLAGTVEDLGTGVAKFDLSFNLRESSDGHRVHAASNTPPTCSTRPRPRRSCPGWSPSCAAVAAEPSAPHRRHRRSSTADERRRDLVDWNDTTDGRPGQLTVPELFARSA